MSERADRTVKVVVLLAIVSALALFAVARADTVTGDGVRIDFRGEIRPDALPRSKPVPVSLHVAGKVRPLDDGRPAGLKRLTLQVNRHALLTTRGLPGCPTRKLRGTSTAQALANCREALIGRGYFTSHIDLPDQTPFPAFGNVLAFNTTIDDRPAVVVHVFGTTPASITTVLASALSRTGPASGPFGPQLTVEMPEIGDDWGYVTSFSLTLHRRYRYQGREMSVVRATCPAPSDLDRVPFKAARGTFELTDGQVLTRTVSGTCTAAD